MAGIICATCGIEHDLSVMEPSYKHPDAYLAVPVEDRSSRTLGGKDDRSVWESEEAPPQYFFRALLPVPVHGEAEPKNWGVWVEVSKETWDRVRELWNAEDQQWSHPSLASSPTISIATRRPWICRACSI